MNPNYALGTSMGEEGIFLKSRDNIHPAWLKGLAKSTVSRLFQKTPSSPKRVEPAKGKVARKRLPYIHVLLTHYLG